MSVKELIEELKKLDQDKTVLIIAADQGSGSNERDILDTITERGSSVELGSTNMMC